MKNVLFISVLAVLFLAACAPETDSDHAINQEMPADEMMAETRYEISPPLEKINVPQQTFEVDPSDEQTLSIENGTEIHIPEGSIVDENGIEVTGKINLAYREFHDVADVLMSGIPMSYDSAGASHTFQTAGMMEIRATKDGKPVFIREGKPIEIRMASFVEEDGYNLYSYEESAGQWRFEDVSRAEALPGLSGEISEDQILAQLPPDPYKPQKLSPDAIPFDFDVDYSVYPLLAPYRDIVWQLAEMQEDKNVDWVFGEIWTSVNIYENKQKKGVYSLSLRNQSRKAEILVTPAVEEENYEAAMAVYREMVRKQEVLKARLLAEAQVRQAEMRQRATIVRAFEVTSFGIYNCDRIYSMETQNVVAANFEVENYEGDVKQVYLVMPEENIVIPYNASNWQNFRYSPSSENKILAILPGDLVAIFDYGDFKKYQPRDKFTFKLHLTGQRISNAGDLKAVLGV